MKRRGNELPTALYVRAGEQKPTRCLLMEVEEPTTKTSILQSLHVFCLLSGISNAIFGPAADCIESQASNYAEIHSPDARKYREMWCDESKALTALKHLQRLGA